MARVPRGGPCDCHLNARPDCSRHFWGTSEGYSKVGSSHFYPSACWSAPSTSRLCRGLFTDSPSLTLGTILSAVDDMVCSPKPTFAALEVAVQASENTHELTSTVVHDTAAQVTRPRTPPPTHRPTLAPTTHMHTTDHRFARYKAATCAVRFHSCPPRAANTTEYN